MKTFQKSFFMLLLALGFVFSVSGIAQADCGCPGSKGGGSPPPSPPPNKMILSVS